MSDRFDQAALFWDQDRQRVQRTKGIADAVLRHVRLATDQILLDYGAGTGQLTLELRPYVRKVVAVDTSEEMLRVLREKISRNNIANVETHLGSVEGKPTGLPEVDRIVSSLVLHHIQDTAAVFRVFWSILRPGGLIAIVDLDEENGEFHTDPKGVYHNGFDRGQLHKQIEEAGFVSIQFHEAYRQTKSIAKGGRERSFTMFLVTACKPQR